MKIKTVKRYRTPEYPTMAAAREDVRLLERVPRGWSAGGAWASLAGLGLLTRALTASAEDAPKKTEARTEAVAPADKAAEGRERAAAVTAGKIATAVAPFLEEAMAFDGRGSFGCVAMNPPVFLSENEALELIQTELERAGLRLKDGMELEGVEAPVQPARAASARKVTLGVTRYLFDLGDEEKSVAVEYFSGRDYVKWDAAGMTLAQSYDFPKLMAQVAESLGKRTEGRPVTVGLFFDPLAKGWNGRRGTATAPGLSEEQAAFLEKQAGGQWRLSWQERQAAATELARVKLRKQVLHFIDYLRREGVLPQE